MAKRRSYVKDGVKVPSVTTILATLDKPALMYWAVNQCVDYLQEVLDSQKTITSEYLFSAKMNWRKASKKALDIGSNVHHAINDYWNNGRTIPDWAEKDPLIMPPLIAFLEWADVNKVEPVATEVTVFYEHDFAGTVDLICRMNGKPDLVLVDYKSAKAIYPEYFLQAGGYVSAWNKEQMLKPECETIQRAGILRLDKETGFPEYVDISANLIEYQNAFLLLTEFYNAYKAIPKTPDPFDEEEIISNTEEK